MMDLQSEQAVWRRVKGPGPGAEEALLPERLEALILEERSLARSLRGLGRRLRGPRSGSLNRLAARAEARAGAMTTLHYLLTGRRLRLQTPPPGKPEPLAEALRGLCLRLRQSARAYEALAQEFSAWGEDFGGYSGQAAADARSLSALLEQQLRPVRGS